MVGLAVVLAVSIPVIAVVVVLHELTHFAAARLVGATDIEFERTTLFLIGFRIHYPDDTPRYKIRLVGLAPLLIGIVAAVLFLAVGGYEWLLRRRDPLLYALVISGWAVYSHVSHADLLLEQNGEKD